MLDVAATAGVSVATVSAFVNGTVPVSTELRGRIEQAIRSIGYKRNAIARSLKMGTTKTIGLVIADITNPFFTDVTSVIQDVLHRSGYAVMLCCTDEDPAVQDEQISLLLDRMVDGLIIAPAGDDHALERMLSGADIPIVLIDRICGGINADAVVLDNQRAVQDAINYLISLGHRRIGYISGSLDTSTGIGRLAGYKAALESAGIPISDDLIRFGNFRERDAYNAAIQLLVQSDRPSALFSANNLMVIGVMKAIRDTGLRCPDDISVSSFDDFPWADVFQPNLTTIAQPVQTIGEQAARLILGRIAHRGDDQPPQRIVLSGRLMIRDSCRPVSDSLLDPESAWNGAPHPWFPHAKE
ncbi:LacI family DNA-binding transcriptional regulator [Rhizobium leguminosarum]|uniref:LacI family DNA-binding transcriptional regulator n=1 Tax=Rhizobium leguminosarum TaxID=384 RepID=UPI0021BBD1C3|nr:LacI family DNA-binding transcriptional regulator [Rhizobium leguminosarum]